jgi:hypothetical protein
LTDKPEIATFVMNKLSETGFKKQMILYLDQDITQKDLQESFRKHLKIKSSDNNYSLSEIILHNNSENIAVLLVCSDKLKNSRLTTDLFDDVRHVIERHNQKIRFILLADDIFDRYDLFSEIIRNGTRI